MFGMNSVKTVAAAGFLALMASSASAVTTCDFGDINDFTLEADVYTTTDCVGQLAGNDSAADLNLANTFGFDTWLLDSRYDRDDNDYDPDGILNIVTGVGGDFLQGTWSVDSWAGVSAAILVLKGGNGFAAYLIDLTAGTSGAWITQALTNNGGQQPNISHISLYVVPSAVPVPAAGFLLFGALAGLAALRRRKTA